MDRQNASDRRNAPLQTPAGFSPSAVKELSGALTKLLADMFALYVKTKNFHWHMSGMNFRDYHLLLDDQADEIFEATDAIAERARKIGGMTLKSVGQIARLQRILDNEADYVTPMDMLAELRDDNLQVAVGSGKFMGFPRSTTMWRPQASWKIGLIRPKSGSGFCLKQHDRCCRAHSVDGQGYSVCK